MTAHDLPASAWVRRFAPLVPCDASVLDVACGLGRHSRLFASLGCRVEAVDRDTQVLTTLTAVPGIHTRIADLEGERWPYEPESFDAIVVTNYLHRPHFDALIATLKPQGLLIYETFMVGNETLGRPTNPEFLLARDELLDRVRPRLNVVAFEQGRVEEPKPSFVQRICATAGEIGRLP